MLKIILKDSNVEEAKKIILNLIDKAEDKTITVEEYFDSKDYEDNLMTRIVNYPHAIVVGEWNGTKNIANQIGRIEVKVGETLADLEKRLKGIQDNAEEKMYEEDLFGNPTSVAKFIENQGFKANEEPYEYKNGDKIYKKITVFSPKFVSPYKFDEKGDVVDNEEGWAYSVTPEEEKELTKKIKEIYPSCKFSTGWNGTIELFEVYYLDDIKKEEIQDELVQSASKKAFEENVKTEIEAGKDPKQAVAIAYSVQEKNK